MDQGVALCEHGGRLVYQNAQNQQKTRQFLSQNSIKIPPAIVLPEVKDEQASSKQKEQPIEQGWKVYYHQLKRSFELLQAYTTLPNDLWIPSPAQRNEAEAYGSVADFSCHPRKPLVAILSITGHISIYSLTTSKFLKYQLSVPIENDKVVAFHWNEERDLLVATASGLITVFTFTFPSTTSTSQTYSILPAVLTRPTLTFCKWVHGSRFLLCGGYKGAWIYDTYDMSAVRVTPLSAVDGASSDQFIAIALANGNIHVMGYSNPMTLSAYTVFTGHQGQMTLLFANSRVLLMLQNSTVAAIQCSKTSRTPTLRQLSSISILREMIESDSETARPPQRLACSGSRVVASSDGNAVLIYLDIETNQVNFRRVGAVTGTAGVALASVEPKYTKKDANEHGFSCLWTDGTITTLPIV